MRRERGALAARVGGKRRCALRRPARSLPLATSSSCALPLPHSLTPAPACLHRALLASYRLCSPLLASSVRLVSARPARVAADLPPPGRPDRRRAHRHVRGPSPT